MSSSSIKLTRLNTPFGSIQSILSSNEEIDDEALNSGEDNTHGNRAHSSRIASHMLLSLAALGAVYGDLGTSPFYTFNAVLGRQLLNPTSPSVPSESDVIGALSNIIWCIVIVTVLKYSLIVLRADYNGEGGDFSIYQLVTQQQDKMWNWAKKPLIFIPVAAASLLICDTTITPAITILGALEGLLIVGPQIEKAIVPLAAVVVLLLFSVQFKGTGKVGLSFGPFMVLWFLTIGFIGAYNIFWLDLSSLVAFNPWKAINWWIAGNYAGYPAFAAMGSVILSVTGAETMFADMGHFGRPAVLRSFYCLVLPCLFLQYCGQGSYMIHLLKNQTSLNLSNEQVIALMNQPFWSAVPRNPAFIYYVELIIATVTSVIASEAVIVGCFTYLNQASHLDFFPPLNTIHTNAKLKGQVYITFVNWILCCVVLVFVFVFESSSALTALYGTAISCLFLLTSITVFFYVAPLCWGLHWNICITLFIIFGGYDAILCTSTLMDKVPAGGWVPLSMAFFMCLFMFTWILGKQRSREGYKEMQARERSSFPFRFPRLRGEDENQVQAFSSSLHKKDINVAMTPVRWRATSARDIDVAMAPVRAKSVSMRHIKLALGKVRLKSKSTPAGVMMDTSTTDLVADSTVASNQQKPLHLNAGINENGTDIESGVTAVVENVRNPEQILLRSPGVSIYMTSDVEKLPIAMLRLACRLEVMPEYAVLCTVHIAEDPFIALGDRVHLCCLNPANKLYQAEIFFGWAESLSKMTTCKFLRDYAVFQKTQKTKNAEEPKNNINTAQSIKEEREEELIQILSNLEVENGLSATFSHNPSLPIVFFVDDTTYKSKTGNIFARALLYAFQLQKRIFGMDPKEHYQLPVNNTIAVGTIVFC